MIIKDVTRYVFQVNKPHLNGVYPLRYEVKTSTVRMVTGSWQQTRDWAEALMSRDESFIVEAHYSEETIVCR